MGKIIGIIAIKGGVGKTTVATSLAVDLARNYDKRVLLVDANYSAPNVGLHMDILNPKRTIHDVLTGKSRAKSAIHQRHGVDVIPGSYIFEKRVNTLKLRDRLNQVRNEYDFIIIDSSPSLNDEILSTILAADNIFVVATPDYPTLFCSFRAARIAKHRGKPISGIILNRIRDPKYEINLAELEEAIEIPVVAVIPEDKKNLRALYGRVPAFVFDPKSKFSQEIDRFGASLTGNIEKRSFLRRVFSLNLGREEVNRQLLKQKFYTSVFK